jgi:hypothetical protein
VLLINLLAITLRHVKGGKHGPLCCIEQTLNFVFVAPFYNIKSNQRHFAGFSDLLGYCVGSMSFMPEASSALFLSTVGSLVSSKT